VAVWIGGFVNLVTGALGHHDTAGLFALVVLTWAAATSLFFSSVNVGVANKELRVGVVWLIFSLTLAVWR
jgi:hypothetical protein